MNEQIKKSVCFTGHRVIPTSELLGVRERLITSIEFLYKKGYRTFLAGGALGFDTLAETAVLALKKNRYADIRLELYLPCTDQAKRWKEQDVKLYQTIIKKADKVSCLADRYYDGCMQERNRVLVENSSVCICYLTRETGGTAQTVRMAKKKGSKIINVAATSDDD